MNIGTAIKTLRVKHGFNQIEFADKIGITQSYLSQIENKQKRPSTELLEHIATELRMPLPVMFWFGVEESDIHPSKMEAYRILKSPIDALINSII